MPVITTNSDNTVYNAVITSGYIDYDFDSSQSDVTFYNNGSYPINLKIDTIPARNHVINAGMQLVLNDVEVTGFSAMAPIGDSSLQISSSPFENENPNVADRLNKFGAQLNDMMNKTSITTNHIFVDNTARDTYFTANPTQLVANLFIKVGTGYQQYIGGAWSVADAVIVATIIDDSTTGVDKTWSSSKIDSVKANKTQEAWIAPTLLNGWTGSINYAKNSLGIVIVKFSLTAGTTSIATNICNLPTGYRPKIYIGVRANNQTSGPNCDFRLQSNGDFQVIGGISTGNSGNGMFMFYAEQ